MQLRFEERERARFGYRMARLTLDSDCEPADAERILEMCRSSSGEMLTLRLPTDKDAPVVGEIARLCFTDNFSHYHADAGSMVSKCLRPISRFNALGPIAAFTFASPITRCIAGLFERRCRPGVRAYWTTDLNEALCPEGATGLSLGFQPQGPGVSTPGTIHRG